MASNDTNHEIGEAQSNKKILERILTEEVDVEDPFYKFSFQTPYKVNIEVCGEKGHQIFGPTQYTYKFGETVTDADVSIDFIDIDYVQHLVEAKKVHTEAGRDKNKILIVNRKDNFIQTHTGTGEKNAQVLMAKIPFFEQIVSNFGTSRQVRPLRDEPKDPIGPVTEGEIIPMMEMVFSKGVDITTEKYKRDFKNQSMIVNWNVAGNLAYQVFEENKYHYELNQQAENADLTLDITNLEFAKRFFLKIPTNYGPRLDENNDMIIYVKTPVVRVKFKDPETISLALGKIPWFRKLNQLANESVKEDEKEKREDYGHYVPVNLPVGDYENVVVPYKVFEYFINKASNIVVRRCPCRERWECKDHRIDLGCIFMGDDTKNMVLAPDEGYVATKEQALEHVRSAIADGLVPLLGRVVNEAEDGHGVQDTGHFLSGCFCCDCCCIAVKTRQYGVAASMSGDNSGGIKGMRIAVDEDKCIGCGKCVEVCAFRGRSVLDGKSHIDPKFCISCGRCVDQCPEGAITIEIEDPDYLKNFINKIESLVDVEDQSLKA